MTIFRRLSVVGKAVSALAFVVAATSTPIVPPASTTAAEEVAPDRAIALREKLGFLAAPDYVLETFSDPRFSAQEFGIPLSTDEIADLQHRIAVQRAIQPAIAAARTLPGYGGVYFDQAQGGMPIFLTTGDPEAFGRLIAPSVDDELIYRVDQVKLTIVDLRQLQSTVVGDMDRLTRAGIDVQAVGLKTQANSVSVGVASGGADAVSMLRDWYGPNVIVNEMGNLQGGDGACTSGSSRRSCWPLMGGLKIWRKNYESASKCTSGMIVRLAQTTNLQMLTAGHCIGLHGGSNIRWEHDDAEIGTSLVHTWQNGAAADAALIDIDFWDEPATKNLYYASSSQAVYGFTGYEFSNDQGDVGNQFVCRSGWKSGYNCGLVITQDAQKGVDGRTILHQWEVDFDACPGDSGGPYLLGYDIWGIHSDSSDDDNGGCNIATGTAWYSPIQWAMTALLDKGKPIVLCLDADC